ncbi:hypothetical protein WMY93_002635 [Mugilogobius chulae]|uniref:Uncharacterized protein n=1 Tax=Mugilogobius chulae TaxID=88201 RepID=A0AAW0PX58_9GOBI
MPRKSSVKSRCSHSSQITPAGTGHNRYKEQICSSGSPADESGPGRGGEAEEQGEKPEEARRYQVCPVGSVGQGSLVAHEEVQVKGEDPRANPEEQSQAQ